MLGCLAELVIIHLLATCMSSHIHFQAFYLLLRAPAGLGRNLESRMRLSRGISSLALALDAEALVVAADPTTMAALDGQAARGCGRKRRPASCLLWMPQFSFLVPFTLPSPM